MVVQGMMGPRTAESQSVRSKLASGQEAQTSGRGWIC